MLKIDETYVGERERKLDGGERRVGMPLASVRLTQEWTTSVAVSICCLL